MHIKKKKKITPHSNNKKESSRQEEGEKIIQREGQQTNTTTESRQDKQEQPWLGLEHSEAFSASVNRNIVKRIETELPGAGPKAL